MVTLYLVPYASSYVIRDADKNIYFTYGKVASHIKFENLKYLSHYTLGDPITTQKYPATVEWIQLNLNNLEIIEKAPE